MGRRMGARTTSAQPFHEGERAVQRKAGERRRAGAVGRLIADRIPGSATGFLAQQPMAVLGTRDADGRVWASLLFGPPGFLRAADPTTIEVDVDRALGHPDDPLWSNLEIDPRFGLLAIDLATRRRLRANGRAARRPGALLLHVEEAYPNCPKYIRRRRVSELEGVGGDLPPPSRGAALNEAQRDRIAGADTFFVASAHPERGLDASHRGGNPGFVRVLDERTLRVPDYPGNGMFNTLGNFAANPAAGLVFPDFANDRTLQLVGRAEIRWDLGDPEGVTGGTGRFWDFDLEETLETKLPLRGVWELLGSRRHDP